MVYRIGYNALTLTLTATMPPTEIHESVRTWIINELFNMAHTGFLTISELEKVHEIGGRSKFSMILTDLICIPLTNHNNSYQSVPRSLYGIHQAARCRIPPRTTSTNCLERYADHRLPGWRLAVLLPALIRHGPLAGGRQLDSFDGNPGQILPQRWRPNCLRSGGIWAGCEHPTSGARGRSRT